MRILLPGEFYYAKIKDKTEGEFKVHTYSDCCKKKKKCLLVSKVIEMRNHRREIFSVRQFVDN